MLVIIRFINYYWRVPVCLAQECKNSYTMKIVISLFTLFVITGCANVQSHNNDDSAYDEIESIDSASTNSNCNIEDGKHLASVDYYNPKTGYSKTYDLDVQVEDCQVTIIYFENGGYLDNSHVDAADIDDDGNASVEDDEGRSFDMHIDD